MRNKLLIVLATISVLAGLAVYFSIGELTPINKIGVYNPPTSVIINQSDFHTGLPKATARAEIDLEKIFNTHKHNYKDRNLGHIDAHLKRILRLAGYSSFGYFEIPSGFILATPIEKIDDDGKPKSEGRWVMMPDQNKSPWYKRLLEIIYLSPKGRYRVMMFVISEFPQKETLEVISAETAKSYTHIGSTGLSFEKSQTSLSDKYKGSVFIYEFLQRGNHSSPIFINTGELSAEDHLKGANIYTHLGK